VNSGQLDLLALVEAGKARNQPAPSFQAVTDVIIGDPQHERERVEIVRAMRADQRRHGHVNPNCVREEVAPWVGPRVLSGMYGVLARKGVLRRVGKVPNADRKGRNLGKDSTVYEWVQQ
jgi:hypothetical protein